MEQSGNDNELSFTQPWSSLSLRRGQDAHAWVEREVAQLKNVIEAHGFLCSESGEIKIEFGELFRLYQDISGSLMGILMRAKKRNVVRYSGHMLYQCTHGGVVITLISTGEEDTS